MVLNIPKVAAEVVVTNRVAAVFVELMFPSETV
jgi:hypothetical protein